MFGIGSTELLVILIVALVVLGPKSLPGIAKTLGKVMGEFRRVNTEFQRTINLEVAQEEHAKRKKEAEEELFGKDSDKTPGIKKEKTSQECAENTSSSHSMTMDVTSDTATTVPADAISGKHSLEKTPVGLTSDTSQNMPQQMTSPLEEAVAKAEAEADFPKTKSQQYEGTQSHDAKA